MVKKLRQGEPLYLAPGIKGWIDNQYRAKVIDEKNGQFLNPDNTFDKIKIYERQVKGWFLNRASRFLRGDKNDLIVLMVCLSYLEGIEQYRRGESSHRRSQEFFKGTIHRLYPGKYSDPDLTDFYHEARCGLFHNGMIDKRIIFSCTRFDSALEFKDNGDIEVNPKLFLRDIKEDFKNYIRELKRNRELQRNFNNQFNVR